MEVVYPLGIAIYLQGSFYLPSLIFSDLSH